MFKQQGYVMVFIIITMVIGGAFVITMTFTSTTGSRAAVDRLLAKQAIYVAEAGLERGKFALLSSNTTSADPLTVRHDCADISFSNQVVGEGEFSVTGTDNSASTTLSVGITAGASVIPVASLSGFATVGKASIGNENIDYTSTSTSPGVCGTAPCLINVARGVDGTTASGHSASTAVTQFLCVIESVGGVPDLSSPVAQRTVRQAVVKPQDIWAVGDDEGGDALIARYDGSAWSRVTPGASVQALDLFGVFLQSASFGWAVGQDTTVNNPLIVRFNGGTSWTNLSTGLPDRDLNSVHCSSSIFCVGVGRRQGGDTLLAHWNGISWSRVIPAASVPNIHMEDVHCLSSTDCFAAGRRQGGDGTIAHWDGVSWTRQSFPDNRDQYAIFCVSSSDCWSGGSGGKVYHYTGAWPASPTDDIGGLVRDIFCVSSTDCWAVGNSRSIQHYDGISWTAGAGVGSLPTVTYRGVSCAATDDCWAVGHRSGGDPTTAHWNGTTWTQVSAAPLPNRDFNDIHIFEPSDAGATGPWEEDFH